MKPRHGRLPRTRPVGLLTREPRRPQMRERPRRLPLRELIRLPTLLSIPRRRQTAKRIWRKSKEAAEEGAATAGHAWEIVKEGAEEAEDG